MLRVIIITSAALIADGYHAKIDGFTSLAVLAGVVGVIAVFPLADPTLSFAESHEIVGKIEDAVMSHIPYVGSVLVDIEPEGHGH
ncbi:MAG TPA: cation transporter dimerization domain-containing protein [Treponemataceae bacterium]|nr:cation transporter dimerization domain-containing protein [Treponemataceae bacterium]